MTTQEIVNYYVNLLIMQYLGQKSVRDTMETFVKQVVADQLPNKVQNAFDINNAVGVQLDVIGKYVGVSRSANGPNGVITLSEPEFRTLIQLGQVTNSFGSSLAEIQDLLHRFFPNQIFVFDYLDMRMSYMINSDAWSSELVQMVVIQDLLPYPMTVGRGSVIYYPILDAFFGFITCEYPINYNNTPFNDAEDYQMDWPWLDCEMAITPDNQSEYGILTEDMLNYIVQENMDLILQE